MSTHSAKIYAIDTYGQMHWWKHHKAEYGEPVGISDIWEGPRLVGTGWQIYEKVFNAGSEIYGIEKDGTLKCYKHALYETGDGVEDTWCLARPAHRQQRMAKVFVRLRIQNDRRGE